MDKIVLIGGDGSGAGASRITGDVTAVLAQLPPIIEALTGVKLEDLLARIPGITNGAGQLSPVGEGRELTDR